MVNEFNTLSQNRIAERDQSKGHPDVVMGDKHTNERSVAESEKRQEARLHELKSTVTGMFQALEQRFDTSIEKLFARVTEVSTPRSVKPKKAGRDPAPLSAPGGVTALHQVELYLKLYRLSQHTRLLQHQFNLL